MKISSFKSLISFVLSLPILLNADITGDLKVCALKVEFQEDSKESTTGNGKFLQSIQGIDCNPYHIDAPPHDNDYFYSQLKATNNYFRSVSYGNFGLDTLRSKILPLNNSAYILPHEMSHYYPYNQDSIAEKRLVDLYIHSLEAAYSQDEISFSEYDLIIVFHAGIGQDFSLPFLDPTPEDIPSTFVDSKMIEESIGTNSISIGSSQISKGIILPESQNHLNFDISNTMFAGEPDPCEYQFGLNGTLSLMIGFAVGLPPLWDIENGKSRIGIFGLMDQGSNNGRGLIPSPPDPWSRIHAGWEKPVDIRSNSQINIPKRSKNNILKVAINENEYFLVENRNNHFKKGVSIDSARFKVYQDTDEYPSFIETLMDSVSLNTDDNGVIVGLPSYDLGLPGSGLLIWHIDQQLIEAGIATYEINKDVNNMGVDLEESDGAQDIGNDSFFPFYDPSSGYFGDMWFLENQEYFRANPQSEGSLPSFTRDTYPNTNANNGSKSYLSFENISSALDTMSLNVYNDIKPYGFHDSTAFYRFGIKPDNYDNYEELVNPINACILAEPNWSTAKNPWSRHVATPDGWTFVIPNTTKTLSYGYVYNKDITPLETAKTNFSELFTYPSCYKFVHGSGWDGYPKKSKQEKYDVIHVGAAAEAIPIYLLHQLKVNGIMVLPLLVNKDKGHVLCVIKKDKKHNIRLELRESVRFVPLVHTIPDPVIEHGIKI